MNELKHIYIYNPAGANYILGNSYEFPLTDSCERSAKVMGEDYVRLVFKSIYKVVFDAFSFIRYNGQTFFLRERYIPTPDGTFKGDDGEISTAYFSYDVKFVSVANMLDKYVCYRHVVVSGDKGGEWNEPEININGNLETMYKIIMGSIQQVAERLSDHMEFTSMLKTIPANGLNSDGTINTNKVKLTAGTKLLTFNFSGDKIANVCTIVANNFTNDDKKDTEWYITEDNGSLTLHFAKYVDEEYGVQYVSDYISNNNGADSFAHPQKSGGLKKVDYAQEWSGITNVIVPYGSTRNMTYQAAKGIDEVTQMQSTFGKRLRLKPNTYYYVKDKDGKDVSFLTDQQGAVRNTSVDTGIEEVRFYDEIYPQGHFRVTEVETKNKRQDGEIVPEYTVSGVAIDSNGNEIQPAEGFYPIAIEEGTTLSVRFEKGLLNGREFEIANKTRKDEGRTTYSLKFTIVADGSLEDGTLIPSGNFIPREGDEFALFNMKMPEVYITAAEKELAQRVYSDLEEAVSKRPEVKCTSDPTTWDKEMALGYQFQVKSEKFNSEDTFVSRVISYSYKLTKPKEIQFNLASAIMQGTLSSMNDQIADVTHQAGGLEQRAINLSRRGWRDAAEMAEMVDSLAADMMLVGNEKYQFAFTAGIEIVNSNNQTTAIKIGEGTLQHTQDPYISDYTCQGWWSHGAVTINNGHTENGSASLVSLPDTPFYLYAVVGQNSDNISFELQDKEQDGEAYLLLGILSSAFTDTIDGVTTNYRVFNRTNGYTQISGGTITTEQIQDAGRNLIIDFQSNPPRIIARNGAEIIGNIKFKASDEKTAEEQLAALGIDVGNAQSTANAAAQAAEEAKNIEIGGRNLLIGTKDATGWDTYGSTISNVDGKIRVDFTQKNASSLIYMSNVNIEANKDYILSFRAKADKEVNLNFLSVKNVRNITTTTFATITTEEHYFTHKFNKDSNISGIMCLGFNPSVEASVYFDEIKLEKGNKATDWSPAPEDYMNAIAESEDNMTEALAESVAKINGGIEALQKQVDGEVSSYFYDTAPVGTDETILTNKEPFSEWAKNYTLLNGVYVLKENARNEFVNHIGDTYTNMEEYKEDSNGNTTTPLAGLAWRWCDATAVSPLPAKYITVSYKGSDGNNITKKLHWHKIADSDAVKALQEAAKAQSTADGKSTTFITEPKNYDIGDLWILAADRTLNGNTYKQGTILTANKASATFVASHWSEDVKYIDEDIARQQAQQALDGLELGGDNLVLESKGDSNKNIIAYNASASAEFQYSCTPIKSDTYGDELQIGLTCSTQGKYTPDSYSYTTSIWIQCKKDTIRGKKYTISFDARLLPESSNTNCTIYFRAAGTGYSTTQMGKAIIDKTKKRYSITVDSHAESDTSTYSYFTLFIDRTTTIYISNVKVEQGNKATGWSPAPEDVDSKADAIKAIAEEAKEDAAESNAQLANMSNDSILTPQEKGSVADEWKCIQQEHDQNERNKEAAWGSATVAEWTAYNTAYTTLLDYVDTLELADRTTNTEIDKSEFQANFANYYSANVAFLNALSKKAAELEVAAMEIGIRNLWAKKYMMDWNDTYVGIATKGNDEYGEYYDIYENRLYAYIGNSGSYNDILQNKVSFESEKQYVLQVKWRNLQKTNSDGSVVNGLHLGFNYSDGTRSSWIMCLPSHIAPTTLTLVSAKGKTVTGVSCTFGTSPNTRIYEIQLVQATKQPNDWMVAPEDVDAAIEEAGYVNIYEGGDISKSYNATDKVKSQVLYSIYSGTYKTSAVENNGYGVNSTDPFHQSTLVVCKAGKGKDLQNVADLYNSSFILGTYYWGDDITVAEGADIVIFFAQKDYIDYCISAYDDYGQEMPSGGSGTWTIRNIKIMTDNASAIKIAQSKAEALDYLKAALTDGSTEIAGGLTMTNVLMLKNLEGFVTAGLSGLTKHNNLEDKVLLWGGGTYEEAYAAANNDTYNTGSGTITTLLKKDGTGKIGIFKISETQAVVDVPNQGKVIIDASTTNGGIRVLNSSGKINAALLPSSISSYKPKEDVNNTVGGYKIHSGISSSSNNVASASVTLNLGSNTTYPSTTASEEVLDTYTKRITYTLECTSVTASQVTITGSVNRVYSSSSQQTFDASNVTVKCSLRVNGTEVKSGSAVKTFTAGASSTGSSNNNVTFSNTITLSGSTLPTLNGGTNTVTMVVTVTLASSQYAGKLSAINLKVTGGQTTINYAHTTKTAYIYQPMTIIGNDGLVSLVGHKTYFMVDNSGSTQKIYAKGLSQTKGEAGSGELYVSDSFITAFKDFLEYMQTWVADVRSIGSNETKANTMIKHCETVMSQLTDTSLIANS